VTKNPCNDSRENAKKPTKFARVYKRVSEARAARAALPHIAAARLAPRRANKQETRALSIVLDPKSNIMFHRMYMAIGEVRTVETGRLVKLGKITDLKTRYVGNQKNPAT